MSSYRRRKIQIRDRELDISLMRHPKRYSPIVQLRRLPMFIKTEFWLVPPSVGKDGIVDPNPETKRWGPTVTFFALWVLRYRFTATWTKVDSEGVL